MDFSQRKKIKNARVAFWCILVAIHCILILFAMSQKSGFHEDEYYSFWSSSGADKYTGTESSAWFTGKELQAHYTVPEGKGFLPETIKTVIANQAADVHPPLYYLLLHGAMALRPGEFHKETSILLNLFLSVASLSVLYWLICRLEDRKNEKPHFFRTAVPLLFYGIAPFVISNVMLARMYVLLSFWAVLYTAVIADLFCDLEHEKGIDLKHGLLCGAICYVSFLTHYYGVMIPFFMTIWTMAWSIVYGKQAHKKSLIEAIRFGLLQAGCIGLAVLTYPASLQHIFYGYRGIDAINGLKNASFRECLRYWLPVLNRNLTGGSGMIILLLTLLSLIILGIYLARQASEKKDGIFYAVIPLLAGIYISCVLTGMLQCKTSLRTGDPGSRYFSPVGTVFLPLLLYGLLSIWDKIFTAKRLRFAVAVGISLLFILPQFNGLRNGSVLFLYKDVKPWAEYSQLHSGDPYVLEYQTPSFYIQGAMSELWDVDHVLIVNSDELETLRDQPLLANSRSGSIIVYTFGTEDIPRLLSRYYGTDGDYELIGRMKWYSVWQVHRTAQAEEAAQ